METNSCRLRLPPPHAALANASPSGAAASWWSIPIDVPLSASVLIFHFLAPSPCSRRECLFFWCCQLVECSHSCAAQNPVPTPRVNVCYFCPPSPSAFSPCSPRKCLPFWCCCQLVECAHRRAAQRIRAQLCVLQQRAHGVGQQLVSLRKVWMWPGWDELVWEVSGSVDMAWEELPSV